VINAKLCQKVSRKYNRKKLPNPFSAHWQFITKRIKKQPASCTKRANGKKPLMELKMLSFAKPFRGHLSSETALSQI